MSSHDDPLRRPSTVSDPSRSASPPSRPGSRLANSPVRPVSNYTPYGVMTAPTPAELELFGQQCRLMFQGDSSATRAVEQTMRSIPAGAKASYTKTMANVRSAWHRDAAASRRAEVDRLLMETDPGSSILRCIGFDSSVSALRSPRARQERKDRLRRFLAAHCVRDMAGVHPFFTSLYVVLHLLGITAKAGGAGRRRIDWDVDTVVFSATGPGSFLRDSIETLKGVLGFEDHLKPIVAPSFTTSVTGTRTSSSDADEDPMVFGHSDGDDGLTLEERQEGEMEEPDREAVPSSRVQRLDTLSESPFADSNDLEDSDNLEGLPAVDKGKARAIDRDGSSSNPFLDPDTRSPSGGVEPQHTSATRSPSILISPADEKPLGSEELRSPPLASLREDKKPMSSQSFLDAPPAPELRTFRTPSYLTDTEIAELVRLFPSFISTKAKSVRFGRGSRDMVNADASGLENEVLKPGHGAVRVSVFERDEGWKGGLLERLKIFILRLLGR